MTLLELDPNRLASGRLKDKVTVITGGAGGLGRAMAEAFVLEGAKVIVADRKKVEQPGRVFTGRLLELGYEAGFMTTDVTDSASVDEALAAVVEQYGQLDVMINNAGITADNLLVHMTDDEYDRVYLVNQRGVFYGIRAAGRIMMEQGFGSIISLSSIARAGNVGQINYAATKAAVVAMTVTAAQELGRYGIRVNAIAPGPAETPMTAGLPDKIRDKFMLATPLGRRFGKPEEVAKAAVLLASDEASFITGQTLGVDGGLRI